MCVARVASVSSTGFEWHYQVAIAGSGSGLPFHWHGSVFAETLHGRRRWFVVNPDTSPIGGYNPRSTMPHWIQEVYHELPDEALDIGGLLQCTIEPGMAIYVPANWWHATLSLGEAVSITTSFEKWEKKNRKSITGNHADFVKMVIGADQDRWKDVAKYASRLTVTRNTSFVPWGWLGQAHFFLFQECTFQGPEGLEYKAGKHKEGNNHLLSADEALSNCIGLNPYFAPCYYWSARVASFLLPLAEEGNAPKEVKLDYKNKLETGNEMVKQLSFEDDTEMLESGESKDLSYKQGDWDT